MIILKALIITLAVITLWTDGLHHKIYNKVLLPFFLVALLIHPIVGLQGAALGFLFLLLPYIGGGIGAGDVKLMAVLGSLLGPHIIITAFFYGSILGGLIALYKKLKKEKTMAYGIPLSLGAVLTLIFPITLIKF
ncbi:MAG TPA: prepilin peptidase [Desulfosporosinus sp.]|nr:prepilin peptidase [Desulfosporosinus sp.]